jgi:predicted ArsR family transcriptional regulator
MTTAAPDELTDRQREVLDLVNEGKNPTQIGAALGISSQGVHGHIRRLRGKGLIPEDYGAPRPAAAPRKQRDSPTAVDPHAAIMAAMAGIQEQRRQLEARLEAITAERVGLDDEEAAVRAALNTLAAMQHPPAVSEPEPA